MILAVITLVAVRLLQPAPRVSGLMPQFAYVWQRAWTDGVRAAVKDSEPETAGVVVLAGQVMWNEGPARVTRVEIDLASLAACRSPVGLAIRVGTYRGKFDGATATPIVELAKGLIEQARGAKVKLAEVQIDFDAAESQLEGYRAWIEAIRAGCGDVPVVITALPSWLGARGFEDLVKSAGQYVLQVHSFEKPRLSAKMTLCDPQAARDAVEKAGRAGVPFRVALPTYAYIAAFEPSGKFIGVQAEGQPGGLPGDAVLRLVRSEAAEMAGLVKGWTDSRPQAMQGILWYRLPIAEDALNWRMATLRAAMAGRAPASELRVATRFDAEQNVRWIELHNAGEADEMISGYVEVTAAGSAIVAADGLEGFAAGWDGATARLAAQGTSVLGAGDRKTVGWIRTTGRSDVEVKGHVVR